MKISKTINFQDVEALSRALKAEKVSKARFSLEIPEHDAANAIYAAVKADVEYRGSRAFVKGDDMLAQILAAARWLINADAPPGLMLCGLYGNGKTTLARAISWLIGYLSEREYGYSRRMRMQLYTAREICNMCAESGLSVAHSNDYARLFNEPMVIIDDLGEEPIEVMVYGMIHTPLIDIISKRYNKQLMTIITTNLNVDELKEKYGERIYDRFREMVTSIVFENDSYRESNR